jgi:hypothetical protein
MIYIPPETTLEIVNLEFPWNGKTYKVKKIPYRDNSRNIHDNDTTKNKEASEST